MRKAVSDMARYTIPKIKYNPPTEELTEEMVLKAIGEMSYQSPVEIVSQNIREKFEGDVMQIIHSYGINVDKDELVKALQYDREQYKQGFADGSKLRTDVIKAEIAFWQDAAANAERETAREIFEKFIIISESPYRIHIIVEKEEFDELKKKYGVTDKNVGCKIEEEKE